MFERLRNWLFFKRNGKYYSMHDEGFSLLTEKNGFYFKISATRFPKPSDDVLNIIVDTIINEVENVPKKDFKGQILAMEIVRNVEGKFPKITGCSICGSRNGHSWVVRLTDNPFEFGD